MRHVTGLLLLSLLSCSSTSSTGTAAQQNNVEFLESIETLKLDYHGALSDEGLPERQPILVGDVRVRDQLVVHMRFFDVTKEASLRIWGEEQSWMRADRVEGVPTLAMLQTLVNDGDARLSFDPRLLMPVGGESNLSVSRTFSYVDSFELHSIGDVTIGDPQINTGRDGLLVSVSSSQGQAPDTRHIRITLDMAQLQRPIPQMTSLLPGSDVALQIQMPVYARQKFEVGATLSPEEFLLVGPLPPLKGDHPLLVLVSARLAKVPGEPQQQESAQ